MDEFGAKRSLHILHLEDEPLDVDLVRAALDADGVACEIDSTSTRAEFTAALERSGIDVILSDFSLPTFDGLSALKIARDMAPEVPFIFVSGTIGEEAAISGVRNGATDYVLKHRLSRLGGAVRRAATEAEELRKRREAQETLRKTEEQLRQSQKMEAVGRLAGGVAHDFNNLLTAIMGYSQLVRSRPGVDDAVIRDIAEVEKAAARAASLTRQLLAFSRQQVLQPKVLDLSKIIVDIDKMLHRLIGEDIDLLTVPAPELGHVKADPGQIEQVVLNLVVNARDAMPGGGKLTIETCNVALDEAAIHSREGLSPGAYVMLAVSDNGTGMDAETRSRIFEPFFTTKEIGRGTGLGLSTVHGIVKQSGGYIEVYSEPGQGSTFKIYLPQVEAPLDATAPALPVSQGRGGSETILVVEDEELVRKVVSESLRLNGYTIIEAADRTEAFKACETCQRNHIQIDLMLSDVVMPGMSMAELSERLQRLNPELKVIYMSGYTDKAMLHQGVLESGAAFLQKPFTTEALLQKVREVLEEPFATAA